VVDPEGSGLRSQGFGHLASAVIAPRDESVSTLVEGAVCEGKNMRAEDLEEMKLGRSRSRFRSQDAGARV
jgi:hypothetical protein